MSQALTAPLLIELGCEDLPARYVWPLATALRNGVEQGLKSRGLHHGSGEVFASPRRLAVRLDVRLQQPEQTIDLTGPAVNVALKDGAPTPAALGFAKKCGVEFAALGQKDGKLHFARSEPGKPVAELIPAIFDEALKGMDELVPKRMRWGSGEATFVRPVSWLLCLLGSNVVPLSRFGLVSGRLTYGHRFHAPAAISLTTPADYDTALRAAKVWADFASRKTDIRRQIETKAAALGGHARITEDLLDEVTALVEWPVVIAGQMEARFLELPPEVIVATVETNQRYFTVFADTALRELTPHFITVTNIESRDVTQVIEGNERVVRPRLSDAMFFWEQDKKQPFASNRSKLANVIYQKELGTLDARVTRIQALALSIAEDASADSNVVSAAAELCKNDLVTKMVFEFPELQGLMGGYYAREAGQSAAVCLAIREHYLPTQQGTPIPSTREGQVLALADKIEQLAGIFYIGQRPTASKDPYALRRAANGVLRICVEGQLPLDIAPLIDRAVNYVAAEMSPSEQVRDGQVKAAFGPDVNASERAVAQIGITKLSACVPELIEFVMERLRALLVGGEVSSEMFEAVKATGITLPLDFAQRVEALKSFVALPAAANLAAAHKRIRNILKQAGEVGSAIDAARFEHDSERALLAAMNALKLDGDYQSQLTALASLREPVDAYFAGVMVNADDPAVRANRLALLSRLDVLCRSVADISLLPG